LGTSVQVFAAALFLLSLLAPYRSVAQQVQTAGSAALTIRGFVSATLFAQDADFGLGNGQNALWSAGRQSGEDSWILSGDVRSTRLALDVAAPEVFGGWRPTGTIELDFFGGFALSGHLAEQQLQPRLRLAYADLQRGGTTVRLGQAWSPSFGYMPASLSHTAFPLGHGSAGVIGSYFPGIFVLRELSRPAAATSIQLQLGAFRGSWEPASEQREEGHRSPGESGIPQLEARVDVAGRIAGGVPWGAYVVGHYDRKDLSGSGDATVDDLVGTALAVGARAAPGPITLQGSAYRGRAVGHLFGNLLQLGDIEGWGAWAQAGVGITPRLSAWGFVGVDDPDDADVQREVSGNARLRNRQVSAMMRLSDGPFALGLEWLHAATDWRLVDGLATEVTRRSANQFALSVLFTF
jgi:hypothetical protein